MEEGKGREERGEQKEKRGVRREDWERRERKEGKTRGYEE